MPEVITKTKEDGSTEEVTMFSQTELDAMRAEDKEHVANKLKEFETGKSAQELKDIERDKAVAEAKEVANQAMAKLGEVENNRIKTVKNFIAGQYVGDDADLRKKLDDAFDLISAGRVAKGLDIASENSIKEIFTQAAGMAGINAVASPTFPMFGGGAPIFTPKAGEVSDADHEQFLKETGYQKPKPPAATS